MAGNLTISGEPGDTCIYYLLALLLVHLRWSQGVGGLNFYPDIPLQHTSSFCKTFSVRGRCVCSNVSSCQNVGNIVVMTKNTSYLALHRV